MKPTNINNKLLTSTVLPMQRGSALPISLFILLVLTIIGTTSLKDTVMEEKMSANFQNGNIAFQAAESSINNTFINIANDRSIVVAAMDAQDIADASGDPPVWPVDAPLTINRGSNGAANTHSSTDLSATVRFVGINNFPATGCTVILGGGNSCMGVVVDVVGTGTVTGTNVTRTHIQGTEKSIPRP